MRWYALTVISVHTEPQLCGHVITDTKTQRDAQARFGAQTLGERFSLSIFSRAWCIDPKALLLHSQRPLIHWGCRMPRLYTDLCRRWLRVIHQREGSDWDGRRAQTILHLHHHHHMTRQAACKCTFVDAFQRSLLSLTRLSLSSPELWQKLQHSGVSTNQENVLLSKRITINGLFCKSLPVH